jgi:hypothetical protein
LVQAVAARNDDELKHVFHSNLKGLLEGVRHEAA